MKNEPREPRTDPGPDANDTSGPDDDLTLDQLPPLPLSEGLGTSIGRYKLLQKLGEGGMGAVYRAEQEKPVRRNVALKIIKPGMDSSQVIARFESERQALALMDHPNIAKVLDAGTTNNGRPYFVMELVIGVPITEYCDDHNLALRERLELFIPVCHAIQHAHQKGIIHRDIKPSNLLVTHIDGKPAPKVIDFGVAKAIDQRLTEKTMYTQLGQIVGTLEYMSPEQADIGVMDIDTRSDIYSLGVVLYEVLTGSTPFQRAAKLEATYTEFLRQIREDVPPKPSTRLSESAATLPAISAQRQTEPARLTKLMRGEVDWIVMKALEKDRSRRYETADGFARDIQRYLDGDPVEAGPPSAGYKLRRLARKHQKALWTIGAFAGLLVMGAAFCTFLAIQAFAAERKAKQSEGQTTSVLEFFKSKVLSAARPKDQQGGLGIDATIRQALDAAEPGIKDSFANQPEVEAAIRDTLGTSYYYLGERALAIQQYERQLALLRKNKRPEDPVTLAAMNNLALAYWSVSRAAEALPLFEDALKIQKKTLAPDHTDTLTTMSNLALAYRATGRRPEAIELGEQTIKLRKAKLGPEHPDTLISMNNVASVYEDVGRLPEALKLYEEALAIMKIKNGPTHPDTLALTNNLAKACGQAGKLDRSIALLEETVRICETEIGADHPYTLRTMANLGASYRDANRLPEGIHTFEEVLERGRKRFGKVTSDIARVPSLLVDAYIQGGQFAKAEPIARESMEQTRIRSGPADPRTAAAMATLGLILIKQEKWAEAEPLLRECLAIREQTQPEAWSTLNTKAQLGGSLLGQKKYTEAEPLLLAGYEGMKQREKTIPSDGHVRLIEALERLVQLYEVTGKPSDAANCRKELEDRKVTEKLPAKRP